MYMEFRCTSIYCFFGICTVMRTWVESLKKMSNCFAFHWCVTCLMSVVYCLVFFDVSVVGYFMRCWLFLDILTIFLNYKVGWHKNLVPVCLASEVF